MVFAVVWRLPQLDCFLLDGLWYMGGYQTHIANNKLPAVLENYIC